MWSLFGSFGVLDNPRNHLNVEDGKVLFAPARPQYRDALAYFRRLYSEQLLDPEGFTQDRVVNQVFAKGRAEPMVVGSFIDFDDEVAVGFPRAVEDYQPLPPLEGPQGHRMWNRYDGEFITSLASFVITSANKSPAVAMRWVNELYDERLALEIARGPFGVTISERPDGSIESLPSPRGMSWDEFRFKNAPFVAFPGLELQETFARTDLPAVQKRRLDVLYPLYKPYFPKEVYPKVLLYP